MKHDLAKEPPTRELLERLIDEARLEEFINKRSPAFKALDLDMSKLTKKRAIELMLEEPNLIRRPLVIAGRRAIFGWNPAEYDEIDG